MLLRKMTHSIFQELSPSTALLESSRLQATLPSAIILWEVAAQLGQNKGTFQFGLKLEMHVCLSDGLSIILARQCLEGQVR